MVILSCNGVLIDSVRIVAETAAASFAESGFPIEPAAYRRRFSGWNADQVRQDCTVRTGYSFPADFSVRIYVQMLRRFETELRPMPHLHHALAWLRQPHCVFSEWPPEVIRRSLAIAGLASHFARHRIISIYDTGFERPLAMVAKMLNQPAGECIFVGAAADMVAAAASLGMRTVGFAGGDCEEDLAHRLRQAGAELVMTDMRQLKTIVAALRENADAPSIVPLQAV